jgi:organic radical activating enzyme
MDIRQWFETYNGVIDNSDIASNAIHDFKSVFADKQAILYGVGVLGKRIRDIFNELDIKIYALVDKNATAINKSTGLDVHEPKMLETITTPDKFVLFASTHRLIIRSIKEDLRKLSSSFVDVVSGNDAHITLQSALCTLKHKRKEVLPLEFCYECSILDNTCSVLARYLKDTNNFDTAKAQGTPNLKMIGYVLGSVCTLNCKHCCESIPYMDASVKKFVPTDKVISDITRLAKACEFLTLLEFVGGEPFLHPGLIDILNVALKIKNIGVIHIFTNGTVTPTKKLCEVVSNSRIVIYISNYTKRLSEHHLSKVAKTENMLRENKVTFLYGTQDNWYDFTSFELVCEDVAKLKNKYPKCFLHNCNRLHNGALYRCPHHYGGVMLNKLKYRDDIIHIHEFSDPELADQLDKFLSVEYVDACKYCAMPFEAPFGRAGVQL